MDILTIADAALDGKSWIAIMDPGNSSAIVGYSPDIVMREFFLPKLQTAEAEEGSGYIVKRSIAAADAIREIWSSLEKYNVLIIEEQFCKFGNKTVVTQGAIIATWRTLNPNLRVFAVSTREKTALIKPYYDLDPKEFAERREVEKKFKETHARNKNAALCCAMTFEYITPECRKIIFGRAAARFDLADALCYGFLLKLQA